MSEFPSIEDQDNYSRALGRLTTAWATLEYQLYKVLISYSGVSEPVGRALFSGLRARAMIEHIRNIAHNTNMDAAKRQDLEFLFVQTASLNTMRDRLTHHSTDDYYFVHGHTHQRIVTDQDRNKKIGKGFEYIVDTTLIQNMYFDMSTISHRLAYHVMSNLLGNFETIDKSHDGKITWCFVDKGK